ncbi:MAG: Hsp20/alpha crystallin family protein [Thermoproteota archaeon]|nr:MAG: Hsp20/alpha crystallin family protein [Candidatus Korarchaeota archaeon]RLG48298.1 MAG: Hsp20/alpha crystallin family protein [Candidatus Korarchaeota archaeon]RLG50195.1 MAG: Hsp20/alpha crystallin family protein [Candidatus Korarchaeota archaeon]
MEEDPFDRWMKEMMRLFKKVEEDLLKSLEEMGAFDWKELEDKFPELETPSGMRVRGPFIQGYYFTIGPDGKPVIKYFGNVPKGGEIREVEEGPEEGVPIKIEEGGTEVVREPVVDVLDFGKEVVIIAEMPGVEEKDIDIKIKGKELQIEGGHYSKTIELSTKVDTSYKKSYKNGILEIRLKKK